jgi:hypothetical protein
MLFVRTISELTDLQKKERFLFIYFIYFFNGTEDRGF